MIEWKSDMFVPSSGTTVISRLSAKGVAPEAHQKIATSPTSFSTADHSASVAATSGEMFTVDFVRDHAQRSTSGRALAPRMAAINLVLAEMAERPFAHHVDEQPARLPVLERVQALDLDAGLVRLACDRRRRAVAVADDLCDLVPRVELDEPLRHPAGAGARVHDLDMAAPLLVEPGGDDGRSAARATRRRRGTPDR